MLCDICKKNSASVHIVKIVNGAKQELNLCESCARQSNEIGLANDMSFVNPFSFQSVLGGLVDYINQNSEVRKQPQASCPICGTTYGEFKHSGLMGCSQCYSYFNSTIGPIIKRVQSNIEHAGKVPLKAGKEFKDKRKLIKLKEELKNAVLLEEYEKAAQIRDKIREIQSGEGEV